ncbi:unnamed protein product [Euphydryas editha]|uniref:Transposase n=1 Tax=Euphydryas editha TaxID=104508 RepID=A0AAU9UH86_EUPED|nr:unnamed protein product [Euphydryas editha]
MLSTESNVKVLDLPIHRRLAIIGLGLTRDRREPGVIINLSYRRNHFFDPTTSTRRLPLRHGVSQKSVWRMLRRAGLHPYHYQRVQHIYKDVDWHQSCVMFTWVLKKTRENPEFTKTILWTDEAQFTTDGIVNSLNLRKWCPKGENPKLKRASTFQVKFSINLEAAMFDNILIGPIILPKTLIGETFLEFLRDGLPLLLKNDPPNGWMSCPLCADCQVFSE